VKNRLHPNMRFVFYTLIKYVAALKPFTKICKENENKGTAAVNQILIELENRMIFMKEILTDLRRQRRNDLIFMLQQHMTKIRTFFIKSVSFAHSRAGYCRILSFTQEIPKFIKEKGLNTVKSILRVSSNYDVLGKITSLAQYKKKVCASLCAGKPPSSKATVDDFDINVIRERYVKAK
jgi:hypothetical protein